MLALMPWYWWLYLGLQIGLPIGLSDIIIAVGF